MASQSHNFSIISFDRLQRTRTFVARKISVPLRWCLQQRAHSKCVDTIESFLRPTPNAALPVLYVNLWEVFYILNFNFSWWSIWRGIISSPVYFHVFCIDSRNEHWWFTISKFFAEPSNKVWMANLCRKNCHERYSALKFWQVAIFPQEICSLT